MVKVVELRGEQHPLLDLSQQVVFVMERIVNLSMALEQETPLHEGQVVYIGTGRDVSVQNCTPYFLWDILYPFYQFLGFTVVCLY